MDEFGRIDILCNVAGAILHKDFVPIDQQDPAVWEKQFKLNPRRHDERDPGGRARSSVREGAEVRSHRQHRLGEHPPVRHGRGHGYAMSKYAMDLFTKQLAHVRGQERHPGELCRPRSGRDELRRHPAARASRSFTPEEAEARRATNLSHLPAGPDRHGQGHRQRRLVHGLRREQLRHRTSAPCVRRLRDVGSPARRALHNERGERERQVR